MARRLMNIVLILSIVMVLFLSGPTESASAAGHVVTKNIDTDDGICDSDCSLREAVDVASSGDVITFHPSLSSSTILLSSTINIAASITIDGSSLAGHVRISGGDSIRIFYINSGYSVTLNHLDLVDGNSSYVSGAGAIYNNALSTLTISNSTFSGNTADQAGGAINNLGIVDISNSTFFDNTANSGGGIYSSDTLTISNSTFNANTGLYGSAVYDLGTSTVYNSTFYQNVNTGTNTSGAYFVAGITTTIINSTFSDNVAITTYPAALGKNTGSDLHLKNTILANSTSGVDAYCLDSLSSDVNNVIEFNLGCGTPISTSDPNLEPLADNGGITQTMAIDTSSYSPAVDAGDPATCSDAGTVNNLDQRGYPRPIDARNTGSAICDIGAYEIQIRYVRTTGNDSSNDCINLSTPCLTVAHAVDQASTSDWINVGEGTFVTSDTIQIGRHVKLIGADMDLTRIDGNGTHGVIDISPSPLVVIIGLTVQNGASLFSGGGIQNSGQLVLSRVKVTGNSSESHGGGIWSNGELDLINSTISDNHTPSSGGGIFSDGSSTSIINSTISGNSALAVSGGIHFQNGGSLDFENVTISDNTADSGGGLTVVGSSSAYILNSTITNNHLSGGHSGGILNNGTLNIKNTIIAGNDGDQCLTNGTWTSEGHNLSSDDNCDFTAVGDIQTADPMLAPLANNGGYTYTHGLLVGSPAEDAGDDGDCPDSDQRGVSRPQGSHCDIGAFEGSVILDKDYPGFYVPSKYRWYFKTNMVDGWSGVVSMGWGGASELLPVTGDWNGDGIQTAGFYKPSQYKWLIKNNQTTGWVGVSSFNWGGAADLTPIAGDWDGDGDDTVGFYNEATGEWFLKDENTAGWSGFTKVVWGGAAGNIPLVGDWDGDGSDTLGFFVPSQNKWWIKNDLVDGWVGVTGFNFGTADPMEPVTGDWDGDGTDTVGGYTAAKWRWYLKDDHVSGWSNVSILRFGPTAPYEVLAGDWQ